MRERVRLRLAPPALMPPHLAGWARSADMASLPTGLALAVRQYLGRAATLDPAVPRRARRPARDRGRGVRRPAAAARHPPARLPGRGDRCPPRARPGPAGPRGRDAAPDWWAALSPMLIGRAGASRRSPRCWRSCCGWCSTAPPPGSSCRRHLPPPTTPAGPPIEAIAADLEAPAGGDALDSTGHESRPSRGDAGGVRRHAGPGLSRPRHARHASPSCRSAPTARPNGSGSRRCSRRRAAVHATSVTGRLGISRQATPRAGRAPPAVSQAPK